MPRSLLHPMIFIGSLAIALISPRPALAQEKYYVLIFAAQGEPAPPRRAHTFAAFVKASDVGGDAGGDVTQADLEIQTISWLPATMNIVPRLRPERGRNFELASTLAWSRRQRFRVSVWGPFEINQQLYDHARQKIQRLDSGAFSYRMIDTSQRNVSTSNCIHAVADVVPGPPLNFGTAYGEPASLIAARHYRPWMRNPEQTHDWLYSRLKLEQFNVQRRGW
jgi:hypothetical protein